MGAMDNDYAYIQTFINFFKQIIEIIKGLFGGLGSTTPETEEEENA